jgi:bacterial/archaeal transporter family-2 protein
VSTVSYALWAFAADGLIPLMAILNAGLARAVGGPVQAAVILFAVGLVTSLLVAAMATVRFPEPSTMVRIPPAQFAGALIVAFYVLSIAIDHYALAGASLRPLTSLRMLGLTIVIIGLVLTQIADRVGAGR